MTFQFGRNTYSFYATGTPNMAQGLSTDYLTYDGYGIIPGLRVFTNDWRWGTVTEETWRHSAISGPGGEYFDGWYDVVYDDGKGALLNGERMRATADPARGIEADPHPERGKQPR